METKLVKIGNSYGIKIPKALIAQYGLSGAITINPTNQGILITSKKDHVTDGANNWRKVWQAENNPKANCWKVSQTTLQIRNGMVVKRFEIWLADLNPVVGSEMSKTRPCIVISPDEVNKVLATVTIAATSVVSHIIRIA